LIKPSLDELAGLVGEKLDGIEAAGAAATQLVESGATEMVAVTMGPDGGLLATADGPRYLPGFTVDTRSTVGAGDSFVAAMVHRLALGWDPFEAFRFGLAAGAAAVLTPGTDMCRPEDAEKLYREAS